MELLRCKSAIQNTCKIELKIEEVLDILEHFLVCGTTLLQIFKIISFLIF